jgi:thiosulfate/3-mercaptopyruvate sulfurtransferase
MNYQTLISAAELSDQIGNPDLAILDCRFSLAEPEWGRQEHLKAHISGAVFADLDRDLSGPKIPGVTGRHPIPTIEFAAEKFSQWGIDDSAQVICYDSVGGALAAVRAWWMLRWLGHDAVAVLDGGWQKWLESSQPVCNGFQERPVRHFVARTRPELLASTADVERLHMDPQTFLLDARTADRYHGENETIDPVAGHIPGAISAPYFDNMQPDLTFRSPAELRAHYQEILGGAPAESAIAYCGSGVTSIHDILAMQIAGLGEGRLYAGSWSEWITDPRRPIARD